MKNPNISAEMDELIKEWKDDGASVEFIELIREVFAPFVRRMHQYKLEERDVSEVCDAVVQLVNMMIIDLGGFYIGVDRGEGRITMEFYNKFLFELGHCLNDVLRASFDGDYKLRAIKFPDEETKH